MSVKDYSPVKTAVCLLPAILTFPPAAIVTGILVTQTNNYRPFIWGGWALLTAGCAMMATLWDEHTSIGVWIGTLLLVGLGQGGILNAQNVATQAMCYPGDEGTAAAMYGFSRHLGMALGVGVGGSTWTNFMISNLRANHLSEEIAFHSLAQIHDLQSEEDSPEKARVVHSYAVAFHGLFCVLLGIAALAFAGSFLLKHIDMNKGFNKFGKRTARSEPLRKKRIRGYLRHFVAPGAASAGLSTAVTPSTAGMFSSPNWMRSVGHAPEHTTQDGHFAESSGPFRHHPGDRDRRSSTDRTIHESEKKEQNEAQQPSSGTAAAIGFTPLSLGIRTPVSAFLKMGEGNTVPGGEGSSAQQLPAPATTSGTAVPGTTRGGSLNPVMEDPEAGVVAHEETEEEMVERFEREHVLQQDAILNSNPPSSRASIFSTIAHSPLVSSILGSPRSSHLEQPHSGGYEGLRDVNEHGIDSDRSAGRNRRIGDAQQAWNRVDTERPGDESDATLREGDRLEDGGIAEKNEEDGGSEAAKGA